MSQNPSVGLAIIVKNGAETLEVCLKSIQGLFDDMVVLDTGSDDGSDDMARSFGARVHYHEWHDDFSEARNASFDLLKTDMAFWLDADDLLCGRECFEEMVRKCVDRELDGVILEYIYSLDPVGERLLAELEPQILSGQVASAVVFEQLSRRCTTTQWRERLVRNDPALRWKYPIHEALPTVGRRWGKYDKIKVIHRRHVRKNPVSSGRNMRILKKIPAEQRDERIWFYLGSEHAHHHEVEASIRAFETYLTMSSNGDEKYLATHYIADLYRYQGNLEQAALYDLRAIELRPNWRDAYIGIVATYAKSEQWAKVVHYGRLLKQTSIPDTPFAFNPLQEEVGWVGDYVRGLAATGAVGEACQEIERALTIVPEDRALQHNFDVLSVSLNIERGKQAVADVVEFFLRHDDAETAAVVLARVPAEFRTHPEIRKWITVAGAACGPAVRGSISKDTMKYAPDVPPPEDMHPALLWMGDPRFKFLIERFAQTPEIRSVLQVGGPLEARLGYANLGIWSDRAEFTDQIRGAYDAVVLWSCLERVKWPEKVVQSAYQAVRPGGWVFAFVPNGPATKGLAPPDVIRVRLRAFSVDLFRRVIGTVQMPEVLGGWSADAGDLALAVSTPLPRGRPKTIAIVCPAAPEPWGPSSLLSGIGGSEEAVIRLSRAFARRGHSVTVYGSGTVGAEETPGPTIFYRPTSEYTPHDVLIGWRYPEIFMNQMRPLEAGWGALWLHDSIPKERVEMIAPHVDRIWCISDYHAGLYSGIPNIYKGRNGIDPGMFHMEHQERNPAKMIWSSTPFRGLNVLLERHWSEIKRRVPEAELHVFYGWESADRMKITATLEGKAFKEHIMALCQQPGVVWRGRVGQPELYREYLSAGVWPYSTTWAEENCITSYIAQAAGAWPVVYPLGALPQSVVFGWKVSAEKFVDSVVDAVGTTEGRDQMMEWARQHLTWDDVAALWERLFLGRAA